MMVTDQQMRRYFEKVYRSVRTPWPSTEPTASVVKLADQLQQMGRKGRVLDLGCGEGRHTFLFAKANFETYGLDYLPLAIKKAQAQAVVNQVTTGCAFVVGDAFLPPFQPQSFDVLIDSGFFHHIKESEWQTYCQHAATLLKEASYFHLTVFSTRFQYVPGEKVRTQNWVIHEGCYDHFFQQTDFQAIFGTWFDIIECQEERFGPRAFWNVLMQKKRNCCQHEFGRLL